MRKKSRVSQQQIARDLGVSQTLVSMVLNGRREGISKRTYEQIWSHARRKGYRPKGMAPEFQPDAKKMDSVGFLLRSGLKLYSQSPFFAHVQHGLHEFLAEKGIALVFLGMENNLDVARLKEMYTPGRCFRGLVVMGEVKRPFLQALKKLEPRIVSVSAQYPGLCHSVISNDEQAAELLVQHLLQLGHRHFAWLGGNRGLQRSKARFDAVNSALRLNNIVIEPKCCVEMEGGDRIDGRQAAAAILKATGRAKAPSAWICFNGVMARGAVNHLLQEGIKIPGDISVAAFDRTRICEEDYPSLTGASTDPELMGHVAGEFILQSDDGTVERFSDTVLASELVARESTGKAPRRKSSVKEPAPSVSAS